MKPHSTSHAGNGVMLYLIVESILTWWLAMPAFGQSTHVTPSPASEALVIIVNKANPVEKLTFVELRKYFLLERERWPDGRKNTVLMFPPGTAEREAALSQIHKFDEDYFTRYFLQATFTGQGRFAPKEIVSAVNMRKFVFNVPGAIGYVRSSEMDDTVKAIRIEGFLPGDAGYPLRIPVR